MPATVCTIAAIGTATVVVVGVEVWLLYKYGHLLTLYLPQPVRRAVVTARPVLHPAHGPSRAAVLRAAEVVLAAEAAHAARPVVPVRVIPLPQKEAQ